MSQLISNIKNFIENKINFINEKERIKADEEYRQILLNSHKENKAFNDKVIATSSAAAIPLLIGLSEKLNLEDNIIYILFVASLTFFILIFLFQIINNLIAIKGCDKGLEGKYNCSNWFFDQTDRIEWFIVICFFIAISISSLMFIRDLNIKRTIKITNVKREVAMKEKDSKKIIQSSKTPHKSERPTEQKKENKEKEGRKK